MIPIKTVRWVIYSVAMLLLLGFTLTVGRAANLPFMGSGSAQLPAALTETATASMTPTSTATETATATFTETATETVTETATSTSTNTVSPSETPEPSKTPEPTRAYVSFTGQITAINADQWTIGDKTVLVTGQTEVDDHPAVGDTAIVKAMVQPDGSLLALKIEKVEQKITTTPQATKVDDDENNETNEEPNEQGEEYHQPGLTSTPSSSEHDGGDQESHSGHHDGERHATSTPQATPNDGEHNVTATPQATPNDGEHNVTATPQATPHYKGEGD